MVWGLVLFGAIPDCAKALAETGDVQQGAAR